MKELLKLPLALALACLVALAPLGCASDDDQTSDGDTETSMPEQEGLEVGEEAPDFRLKDQEQATVALSDYRGVSNVILVFYPLAFTPV